MGVVPVLMFIEIIARRIIGMILILKFLAERIALGKLAIGCLRIKVGMDLFVRVRVARRLREFSVRILVAGID